MPRPLGLMYEAGRRGVGIAWNLAGPNPQPTLNVNDPNFGQMNWAYDAEGLPVEPEGFTTYGEVSGGTNPLGPVGVNTVGEFLQKYGMWIAIGGVAFLLLRRR
jgi:hypothetical protein